MCPPLKTEKNNKPFLANTFPEKVEAFKKYFYPLPSTNFNNSDFNSPDPPPLRYLTKEALPLADEEEVFNILNSKKPFIAPGIDGYPYAFLKALGEPFIKAITPLITAY